MLPYKDGYCTTLTGLAKRLRTHPIGIAEKMETYQINTMTDPLHWESIQISNQRSPWTEMIVRNPERLSFTGHTPQSSKLGRWIRGAFREMCCGSNRQ